MTRNTWLFLALVAMPLAGCFNSADHQFAKCEAHSRRLYPSSLQSIGYKDEIQMCMGINGYGLEGRDAKCTGAAKETNPACYAPNHSASHWLND